MSITDTSLADPISPLSVDSTVSAMGAWEAFRRANGPVWAAERATRCAAIRNELDQQIVRPRTAADALADIKRYSAMLTVPAVLASKGWTEDVTAKLIAAKAELQAARAKALRVTGGMR